jgi:hypothetical protein
VRVACVKTKQNRFCKNRALIRPKTKNHKKLKNPENLSFCLFGQVQITKNRKIKTPAKALKHMLAYQILSQDIKSIQLKPCKVSVC